MPIPTISMGGVAPDLRHPRIGYDSLGAQAGLTVVTNEIVGYEGVHLFDYKPYTYWQSPAGINTVTVTIPSAKPCNYFAYAQHNLGTVGATLTLLYSLDGGVTFTTAASVSPSTNDPAWLSFPTITAALWQVQISAGAPALLAIAYFGAELMPTYGDINGWTPPTMARTATDYTSETEGGNFLARSILRRGQSFTIQWDHQLPLWMWQNWLPFMKFAEGSPFFLLWNRDDFGFDVALVRTEGQIPHPFYSRPGRMAMSLKLRGLITS